MDIDIDFGDRDKILKLIKHIPASIKKSFDYGDEWHKHNTGIYVTEIPMNPVSECASIDYNEAEARGYFKLDMLNVHLYQQVTSETELVELMTKEPSWDKLLDREFCSQLIHIGNHYDVIKAMPPRNIEQLAMILAIIRPGKRGLVGKPWEVVQKTIWEKEEDGYSFKKSHATAYAHLVVVNMNLLERPTPSEQG